MGKFYSVVYVFLIVVSRLTAVSAQEFEINALNSRSNLLYAGVDNYLTLNQPIVPLMVECSNGYAFVEDSLINIIPERSGRILIKVYTLEATTNDTVQLFSQHMIVSSLPPAKLMIGNTLVQDISLIDRNYLINNNRFMVHLNDDILDSENWMTVDRIIIGYLRGGYYHKLESYGNQISPEVMDKILIMRPGQEISLQVRVKCEGDIRKTIPVHRAKLK